MFHTSKRMIGSLFWRIGFVMDNFFDVTDDHNGLIILVLTVAILSSSETGIPIPLKTLAFCFLELLGKARSYHQPALCFSRIRVFHHCLLSSLWANSFPFSTNAEQCLTKKLLDHVITLSNMYYKLTSVATRISVRLFVVTTRISASVERF